jgi:hypothetical protein
MIMDEVRFEGLEREIRSREAVLIVAQAVQTIYIDADLQFDKPSPSPNICPLFSSPFFHPNSHSTAVFQLVFGGCLDTARVPTPKPGNVHG